MTRPHRCRSIDRARSGIGRQTAHESPGRTMFDRFRSAVNRATSASRNQYAVQVNVPAAGWLTFATDIPHATAVDIADTFTAYDIHPDDIAVRPADDLVSPGAAHVSTTMHDIPQPYETAFNAVNT